MRNAGLSEARCQNEVSESKAPAASSITSKVKRSKRLTKFSKQTVCPTSSAIGSASRGQTHNVFQSRCRAQLRGSEVDRLSMRITLRYRQTGDPRPRKVRAKRWRAALATAVQKNAPRDVLNAFARSLS